MIVLLFVGLAVTSILSAITRNFRTLVISTLGVHLFLGALALQLEAEFFALMCFISGFTLVFALTVFGANFGELIQTELQESDTPIGTKTVLGRLGGFLPAASIFVSAGVSWMLTIAFISVSGQIQSNDPSVQHLAPRKLYQLGELFMGAPFLSVLVLALAVFTAALGVGAITRPRIMREVQDSEVGDS